MRSNNSIAGPSIRMKYFSIYGILVTLFLIFVYTNINISDSSSETEIFVPNVIKSFPFERARFDTRRILRIYEWIWMGNKWKKLMENFDVCLSTQASLDRIHWILQVIDYWQGPISLAIYITSPEEWMGLNLLVNHFHKCSPMFRDFVSIHVAVPSVVKHLNINASDQFTIGDDSCENSEEFIKLVVDKYQPGVEGKSLMTFYPQNHMRNIARKGCGTEWVFSSDIDIIPRPNSARLFQEFHDSKEAKNCKQCAYVIPTFELDATVPYPSTKSELVEHWNQNQSRPFHFNVFMQAHNATDYSKWSKTELKEGPIKLSHDSVKKLMKYYEPFYISPDTIPAFEERFIGYGFTRSSQVQEALAEGWTFKVLTPIFGIHWGMQSMKTLISPGNKLTIREEQTMNNRKVFDEFMKELKYRKSLQKY